MYIFLDESKALHKNGGKFILAGLVTTLKPGTIDKIYYNFLRYKNIREIGGEVKSFNKKYRDKIDGFYDYIKGSVYGKQIQFIGIYSKNYKESGENYYHSLKELLYHTVKYTYIDKNNFNSINIISDNIKLNYSDREITNLLNQEENLITKNKGYSFIFQNSKKYGGIKFADFIAGKLREVYITKKQCVDTDFIEYFVNEEISFIVLE